MPAENAKDQEDPWMSATEAGRVLEKHRDTVLRRIAQKTLPVRTKKMGGVIYLRRDDVLREKERADSEVIEPQRAVG